VYRANGTRKAPLGLKPVVGGPETIVGPIRSGQSQNLFLDL
jgi:hypothetical protein